MHTDFMDNSNMSNIFAKMLVLYMGSYMSVVCVFLFTVLGESHEYYNIYAAVALRCQGMFME